MAEHVHPREPDGRAPAPRETGRPVLSRYARRERSEPTGTRPDAPDDGSGDAAAPPRSGGPRAAVVGDGVAISPPSPELPPPNGPPAAEEPASGGPAGDDGARSDRSADAGAEAPASAAERSPASRASEHPDLATGPDVAHTKRGVSTGAGTRPPEPEEGVVQAGGHETRTETGSGTARATDALRRVASSEPHAVQATSTDAGTAGRPASQATGDDPGPWTTAHGRSVMPASGGAPAGEGSWEHGVVPVRSGRTRETPDTRLPLWKRIALPFVQAATGPGTEPQRGGPPARPVSLDPLLTRLNALEKQLAANQAATESQLARFEENLTRLWELEEQMTITEVRERLALLEANQEEIADGLHAIGRHLVLLAVVLAAGLAAGLLALGLLL